MLAPAVGIMTRMSERSTTNTETRASYLQVRASYTQTRRQDCQYTSFRLTCVAVLPRPSVLLARQVVVEGASDGSAL
jgi:hypothetical protein